MGKPETIGFVLIAVVLILWMFLNAPEPPPPSTMRPDTVGVSPPDTKRLAGTPVPRREMETPSQLDTLGRWFGHLVMGEEKIVRIETDLYVAEVTTKGGVIRKFELKEYKAWDGDDVQLVDEVLGGDLSYLFTTSDGKIVNTRNLYYTLEVPTWFSVRLQAEDSVAVKLILPVAEGSWMEKTFIFKNGLYSFDVETKFVGMEQIISNFEYQVVWSGGLRLTESRSVDEAEYAAAFVYIGRELEELDAADIGEEVKSEDYTGATDWVAVRNKYFAVALIPQGRKGSGAYLAGTRTRLPDGGDKENYTVALKMPFKGREDWHSRLTVFLGPLQLGIVKSYGVELDRIMSLGWVWIRPISVYFIIPLFTFLHSFIPNYGLVIIVFSIVIKVLLYPLTRTSMRSMQKMQSLQPMMTEIREKYKDNPQKMNEATMRLYKDYGVNPAGGCLPLLLQMPILYALWSVFRSTIELRQADFFLWITDLSVPDVIAQLGVSIPLLGSHISGLAFLMGATMFIQQKMTMKDPKQKMMVWMMPVFLTLLFNNFPSGLNLYYFMFNLLSIAQQMWLTKQHKGEPLQKVVPKKKSGGLFSRMGNQLQLSKMSKRMRR
ncbi:MAG: membrane protein insertase YidC [Bacteroidota bacterium]